MGRSSKRLNALFVAGCMSLAPLVARAEVPVLLTFQGRISGLAESSTDLEISLYDVEADGVPLHTEQHLGVALNEEGVFSISIGEPDGGLDAGLLGPGDRWIGVAIVGELEFSPRVKLTSIPHAVRAESALQLVAPDSLEAVVTADADHNARVLDDNGDPIISLNAGAKAIRLAEPSDDARAVISVYPLDNDGVLALFDATNHNTALVRGGEADEGGEVLLYGAAGWPNLRAALEGGGDDGAGGLKLYDSGMKNTVELDAAFGAPSGGSLTLRDTAEFPVAFIGNTSSGSAVVMYPAASDQATVFIQGDDRGRLTLSNNLGQPSIALDADIDDAASGQIRVLNPDNQQDLIVLNTTTGGAPSAEMELRDTLGGLRVELQAQDSTGGRLSLRDETNLATVELVAHALSGNTGGELRLATPGESPTIRLVAGDDNGNGRVITQVVEITGGSDLSENFDITAPDGEVVPGMVVSIDPAHPGKLLLSRQAYDHTVAGVISGAGGVNPGFVMGQKGSVADGEYPVALTGRVWTFCDAGAGAIQPGDLLTTSRLRGHAMKVSDPTRAHGAILGKAMTALPQGRGLVLVLVSLH